MAKKQTSVLEELYNVKKMAL